MTLIEKYPLQITEKENGGGGEDVWHSRCCQYFVYFDALNTKNTACNYNFQSGKLLREDAGVSWFLKSVIAGQF